jgi:hypothetical protein
MIMLAFVLAIMMWLNLGEGNPVDSSSALTLISVIFLVGLTYWASRPPALERAVSVFDMIPGTDIVILQITPSWYADELMRLNPMTAKRVRRVGITE